ncbi:MAG: hypothetical protein O3A21_05790 [Proteobacteria bacterium]|nr:hypothetical protein [Pseudomonadota bacterium]
MDFLIEYRVPADKVAEQEAAVRDFISAVKASNDPAYRYTSFRKPDGVSFVHHAWMADEAAQHRFQALPEFKPFADGLKARAEQGPEASKLKLVATSGK